MVFGWFKKLTSGLSKSSEKISDGIKKVIKGKKIVLVEVPSNIYSELRGIFVNLFENSGFKDIKISENVDFKKLYDMRKTQ